MTGSEKQKWSMVTREPTTDGVGEGGYPHTDGVSTTRGYTPSDVVGGVSPL